MRLNETLYKCIRFANFAKEHDISPIDLAEMIALGDAAIRAGTKHCNVTGAPKPDKQYRRFEEKAKVLGFHTSWPGLAPVLAKGQREFYLPE